MGLITQKNSNKRVGKGLKLCGEKAIVDTAKFLSCGV